MLDPEDGSGWTSSVLTNGVRNKPGIDWMSGRWTLVTIPGDAYEARERIREQLGRKYDYFGLMCFVLPWRVSDHQRWFCTEILAHAIQAPKSWTMHPIKFFEYVSNLPGAVVIETERR